jgi:hypothetical protein
MAREPRKGEEIFLEHISTLIRNLLVTNVNYTNGHYVRTSNYDVIVDTKERANYILEEMERTKHLINL